MQTSFIWIVAHALKEELRKQSPSNTEYHVARLQGEGGDPVVYLTHLDVFALATPVVPVPLYVEVSFYCL